MTALDAFGLFILALFRRAPKPAVPAGDDALTHLLADPLRDPLAELRAALERQIEADEAKRRRWGDHG